MKKTARRRQVCRCGAYAFPHARGGGVCHSSPSKPSHRRRASANRATPKVEEQRRQRLPEAALARGPIKIHDLDVYTWEDRDRRTGQPYYGAIAFVGNQGKPIWYTHFRTSESRDQAIIQATKQRREAKRYKEGKKKFTSFKEGDILEASWGYDQTNVDFYQVVAVRGAMVEVQEIGQSSVANARHLESGSDRVVPDPSVRGKVHLKRQMGSDGKPYIRMGDSRGMTTLWDGTPQYQTASGWGH